MRAVAWLVLLTACGSGRAGAPDAQAVGDSALAEAVTPPPDTTYPPGRRGALIARSAIPSPLSGEWRATAGVCGEPPSFQLLASGDSVDVILLLRSPTGGWAAGAYAVAAAEDTVDAPGAARLGVQRVLYVDEAYRGERGSVELSRLDRLVSGRFDVVLREFYSRDTVRYLGVFDRIRVDSLPAADCQAAARGLPPGVH